MPVVPKSDSASPFARIRASLESRIGGVGRVPDGKDEQTGTVVAPDGMERNAVVERSAGMTLSQVVQKAKKAGVPQREQIGPTCGLYALGMVLDSWHEKDPNNATALVQSADVHGRGKHFNFDPTHDDMILDVAKELGFTAMGEMFTARQLAQTAKHYGYEATTHDNATLEDLYRVLDAGHPAIVGFDVDRNGNPGDFDGERAHYAVIQGYFDDDSSGTRTRYLVARHGWAVQKDHVWKASDFLRSWDALHTTTYYGTPGDGVIPRHPDLKEPAELDLPAVGANKAGIYESLARKIVEVVPPGVEPVGGVRA